MRVIPALVIFISIHAHALGPIPNGQYRGTQNCTGKDGRSIHSDNVLLEVSDKTLQYGSTLKELDSEAHGFFKFKHFEVNSKAGTKTKSGQGDGYITRWGVHMNATLNIGNAAVTGEDTFYHRNRRVYLVSSAAGFKCEGRFDRL